MWISLIGFTLLYAVLAIVEVGLIIRTSSRARPRRVADPFVEPNDDRRPARRSAY